ILFISRLTDERRTKAKQFLTACDELLKTGDQFTVKVADPNRSMTDDEIRGLCASAEITRFNDKQEYYEALWRADIVPILYPLNHIYSVGHCEAAYSENVIITMGDHLDGHVVVTNDNIKMAIREAVRRVREEDKRIDQITEGLKERDVMWSYGIFNRNMEEIFNEEV
ncbi:hypothetical protein EBZ39_15995, partial [bacterium]|nr:hypothetical protein [bacterium]